MHAYVKTIQRHAIAIVLCTVLGAIVGYAHAANTDPTYRSNASVLLTTDIGGNASDINQSSNYLQNIVASYVLLAGSDTVLTKVVDELGLDITARQLSRSVDVSSPLNTVVIDLAVVAGDPDDAQRIARSLTRNLSSVVARVSPKDKTGKPVLRLSTIGEATLPQVPIAPNTRREMLLGAAIGLLLGAIYAFARRFVGEGVRDAEDVSSVTDLPVVGEIVESGRKVSFLSAVLNDSRGPQAESVQGLVANLSFLDMDSGLASLVVTSATPQESKSSVAVALAASLAGAGRQVLLVDCDLRNPSVGKLTGLEDAVGVSNVLSGQFTVTEAVQQWLPGVDVLSAGPVPPNPAQMLSSPRFAALIQEVEKTYDFVLVDSAPVLVAADAVWLGHSTDGVLLLCRRGRVSTAKLSRALEILRTGQTNTLGVVLTRMRARGGRYGRYGRYGEDVSEFNQS
nr:polysaccharide biosynthesis tyrosine autokinase [Aeromicrobium senzhongii]